MTAMHADIRAVIEGRSQWCVIEADCLDVLKTLPEGCVDAVVTDIPYGKVNRTGGGLRNLDKGDADIETFSAVWAALESAKLASGSVYLWCGTEQVSGIRANLVCRGMTTRLCVWEKTNPSPMNGDRIWLSSIECCVFGRHPLAFFNARCESPVWRGPTEGERSHPTQKPLWLMSHIIRSSVPLDGLVLDFCAGSGTTGVACIQTGRRFIGIEIEKKYVKIARRRIADAAPLFVRQPTPEMKLFTDRDPEKN